MTEKPLFKKFLLLIAVKLPSNYENPAEDGHKIGSSLLGSRYNINMYNMQIEAYYIGNSPATESYLSIKNIITAIRKWG